MKNRKDIFYYARFYGIPIYYQPEEGDEEIVGRNWFCQKLVDLVCEILFIKMIFVGDFDYKIVLYEKTITRQEIIDKLGDWIYDR